MANEDDTAHSSEMISQVSAAGSDEPQQSSSPPQAPSTPASNATVSRANEITEEMRQQWMPFIESIAVEGTLPKSDGSWHTVHTHSLSLQCQIEALARSLAIIHTDGLFSSTSFEYDVANINDASDRAMAPLQHRPWHRL